MAVVQWVLQAAVIDGQLYKCTPLAAGDESAPLQINEGQADISVQVYGTVGGSTVTVQGSLVGTTFNTLEDAYGTTMSYTAIGVCKPVGPAVHALKVVVTGGTSVAVTADVLITQRRQP